MSTGFCSPGNARPWRRWWRGLPATAIAVKTPTIATASGGCGRSMGGFAFSRSESKRRKWWSRKLRERGRLRRGHSSERSQAKPHQLGVTCRAGADEVGSGRPRSSASAGRHRIPDRAGSVLRAHFCGTVPRTTWIRGLGKGTPSPTLIHLRKKRRNGTGGERATTVIASDRLWRATADELSPHKRKCFIERAHRHSFNHTPPPCSRPIKHLRDSDIIRSLIEYTC